jgi:hypothetical protein
MPELVEYLDSGKAGARDAKGQRIFLSRQGPSSTTGTGES